MAQQVKVIAAKPVNLSLIPRNHMMGGENKFLREPSDHHMCAWHMHPHIYIHMHIK